jgi:pimeloyl-ACP methyl ester carboxylesterase
VRFVLVHGGFHGAWCWTKLAPELERLGHDVVAIDLPGAGERMHETATLESWRRALCDVVEDGDVLVGHSQGGFAISLAADEVPDKISRLVYLSAAVPVEGRSMVDAAPQANDWPETIGMPEEDFRAIVELPEQGPCVALTNPAAVNKVFYHDCTPEDQAWAFECLTPLVIEPTLEVIHVPRFWNAAIPRSFIMCTDDFSHPISADNEFMRRLGLSRCVSIVSSHSPFLSRPAETATLVDLCAQGVLD